MTRDAKHITPAIEYWRSVIVRGSRSLKDQAAVVDTPPDADLVLPVGSDGEHRFGDDLETQTPQCQSSKTSMRPL